MIVRSEVLHYYSPRAGLGRPAAPRPALVSVLEGKAIGEARPLSAALSLSLPVSLYRTATTAARPGTGLPRALRLGGVTAPTRPPLFNVV